MQTFERSLIGTSKNQIKTINKLTLIIVEIKAKNNSIISLFLFWIYPLRGILM